MVFSRDLYTCFKITSIVVNFVHFLNIVEGV